MANAFKVMPQNPAEWGRVLEQLTAAPKPASVTPESLAPSTVEQIQTVADTAATDAITALRAESDPFPVYATDDAASALAANAQATAISVSAVSLATHVADSDPHPVYMTAAEVGDEIAAHEAALDPHPGYLTQTEGDARYLPLSPTLTNAVDDAAAASAGVAVGRLYRNGSVVMIRVS